MSKFRSLKNSFIAGQISPTAMGRTDIPQYVHGAKTLQNVIPLLSGGVYGRPGTLFDRAIPAALITSPRLIPFVVSLSESYILVLYKDTIALPAVAGILAASRRSSNTAPSFQSTVTGFHPYDPTGSNELMLDEVQYAQSVDVMTLVHPSQIPQRVFRTAQDAFTILPFHNGPNPTTPFTGEQLRDSYPYFDQNSTGITLAINTTTVGTGRIVTANAAFFNALHVGAFFKSDDGTGNIGCFQVTGFTNSTTVTVSVMVALGTTGARATWWESAWSDYRGWPRSVGFFQQRMVYGGTATSRDSVWLSQSGNFDAMSVAKLLQPRGAGDGTTTGPKGLQPFTIELSSQQLDEIQWVSPDKQLAVGTLGKEFFIDLGPNISAGFGCDNYVATPQSHIGSSYHMPIRIGSELIFATRSNDALKSLIFNFLQNAYQDESLQLLFDQYPAPSNYLKLRKYRGFSWDSCRSTLWCHDVAGNVFAMTRDKTLQVTAWHTHQLGGFDSTEVLNPASGGYTNALCSGSVGSIATIPNSFLGTDDVWFSVLRKINGAFYWHIERMIGRSVASDTVKDANLAESGNYYVDSCVFDQNGFVSSTTEDHISHGANVNYAHLEGEAVSGTTDSIGDGKGVLTLRPSVVSGGVVPLVAPYPPNYDTEGYYIAFGLPYTCIVEPVRIEAGSQIGTAQGAIKRIHKATLRLYRTLSAKLGASVDELETLIFRQGDTPMDEGAEFFTGDKTIDFSGDYDRDAYIYLTQDQPLPFAVMSIIAEGQTDD